MLKLGENYILESVKVPLPPLELQNQFADFVKQVDKLKFEMEESLKEHLKKQYLGYGIFRWRD